MRKLHPAWRDWADTKRLVAAFAQAQAAARFVGGGVRDALLGRDVGDVDLATKLTPEAVTKLLEAAEIKVVPTGLKHGTVTAVLADHSFEITTLRRDVSTDGRHAEVAFTSDWKEDAARRDFTMNALYLSFAGELTDYFGGAADAKAGHVRFIGDAEARIKEDYLRILRFFRFHAHYGRGAPDAGALSACGKHAAGIEGLSGERIQTEMFKLLAVGHAFPVVKAMFDIGVLGRALGTKVTDISLLEKIEREIPGADALVKLAALLGPLESSVQARAQVADRLKLSNAMARPLRAAEYFPADSMPAHQDALFRRIDATGFAVSAAVSAAASGDFKAYAGALALTSVPDLPVTGDDLIARGFAPGREMGETLQRLQGEWANSGYRLTREQLLAKIKK